MAWSLGLLGASIPGPQLGEAFEHIQTIELSSAQTTISFTNLDAYSNTFRNLQLRMVARTNRTGYDNDPLVVRFNSDTASNYWRHFVGVYRPGSGRYDSSDTSASNGLWVDWGAAPNLAAQEFAANIVDIFDVYDTNKIVSMRSFGGLAAAGAIGLNSGSWNSTTPVSSIQITSYTGNTLASGFRASLYGIGV